MVISWNQVESTSVPNFKGGEKDVLMKAHHDDLNRIMHLTLVPGSSIGMHTHEAQSEIMFFLNGEGKVIINDETELVHAGQCHYCPKGSTHMLINTGNEDLVLYAVVCNQ